MSEWKAYKLGDITNWYSGGTPSKDKKDFWNGNIPWISAKTMTDYKVSYSELNITEKGLSNGSRLAIEKDILLLVRGSGLFIDIPINIVEKPVAFNQDIKVIRAREPKLQDFIFFWLHGNKKGLNDILEETGIGAGKFDTDLLKKLEISIPTNKKEFDFIVETAKGVFDKIDLLHRQNTTLEKMAETLFRQWFVEEAKEEWVEIKLGSIVEIINGVSYKSDDLNPSTTAMITLKSFDRNGGFRMDGFKEYTGKYKEQHLLNEGDLVVAHTDITQEADVIGNPVLVIGDPKYNTLVFSMDLVKVMSKDENYSNEFLYLLMKSREFKEHCLGYSNGSTVLHLSKKAIPEYEMRLPPNRLINEFSIKVKPLLQKQFINQTQIRTLTALRDTLLPKLMSGEVRVSEQDL